MRLDQTVQQVATHIQSGKSVSCGNSCLAQLLGFITSMNNNRAHEPTIPSGDRYPCTDLPEAQQPHTHHSPLGHHDLHISHCIIIFTTPTEAISGSTYVKRHVWNGFFKKDATPALQHETSTNLAIQSARHPSPALQNWVSAAVQEQALQHPTKCTCIMGFLDSLLTHAVAACILETTLSAPPFYGLGASRRDNPKPHQDVLEY